MRYKGIIIALVGIFLAIVLSKVPAFHNFIKGFAEFGYLGVIVVGIFFVSTFTVATSLLALVYLLGFYNPFYIALLAGFGAVIGDLLIFRFVRDNLSDELKTVAYKIPYFRDKRIIKLIHNHYFAWILPFVGAVIIASPFPDEIGVSLLGLSKVAKWRFVIISFLLNTVGIFVLLLLFA
jgi:uncharacterized membrane protein YdjX (TVP38/TMEM64 family)